MRGRGNVVIIGCGPAGLAAAEASIASGHRTFIASQNNEMSTQYGCQYLHAPIPGFESAPHTRVGYYLNGTPEQYRKKVYGAKWQGKVSPEDFVGEHEAWDIRETYEAMWHHLHSLANIEFVKIPVVKAGVLPAIIDRMQAVVVISTIPAMALCHVQKHRFNYHMIYATGSVKREDTTTDDTIICDGTTDHEWYRNACVFGYRTIEWASKPNNGERIVAVPKPLVTDCDCYPGIHKIGRYGRWQKSYLVHQAYPDVMEILK